MCSCSLRGDLLSTRKLSCHLEAFRASTMGLKMEKLKEKNFELLSENVSGPLDI